MAGAVPGRRGADLAGTAPSFVAPAARVTVDPRWFVTGIMVCATFLQRFGIPFGAEQMIPISGPIGLLLAAYGLVTGAIALHRRRLLVFVGFLTLAAVGRLHADLATQPFNALISTPSYMQFLGITAFTVFVFARPMDELAFFRLVNLILLVIACCGILQFAAQLAGLQVFRFSDLLPPGIVAERGWNLVIGFGIGELLKSNGFFLVEPSVTSQFMAIALIIEVLYFRRVRYLAGFGLCFVLANSGTGGLVLFGFVASAVLRLGLRGMLLALLMLLFGAAVAGAVLLLAPEIATMAHERLGEFQTMGTSGHARFVTPFWLLSDVLDAYPATALFGLGAGTSEKLTLPYGYDVNTPIKIGLEYGFPALLLYFALFIIGDRTPRQGVLVIPVMILLMFTGGYQQYAPIMFLMTMLICTARLTPETRPGAAAMVDAARRAPA